MAGGKYTTCRLMSEEASDLVCREVAPELAGIHVTAPAVFPHVEREIGEALEDRQCGWEASRVQKEMDAIIEATQPVGA